MEQKIDYSKYECPYSHLEKECGHELHSPEGYQDVHSVWCQCGYRGPVFYLDPKDLGLKLKTEFVPIEKTPPKTAEEVLGDICFIHQDELKIRHDELIIKPSEAIKSMHEYASQSSPISEDEIKEIIQSQSKQLKSFVGLAMSLEECEACISSVIHGVLSHLNKGGE